VANQISVFFVAFLNLFFGIEAPNKILVFVLFLLLLINVDDSFDFNQFIRGKTVG